MIRILQVVNNMHRAGLETMLMNYYRHVDRNKIQFDFLTHRSERADYDDEIKELGGKIYHAPRLYPQNYPAYFKYMKNFFQEHPEYKIVHSHIDSMSYLPLKAAKKAGVPIRIAHSHNTSIDKDFKYPLKQLFRIKINSVATHRCACGEIAGDYLFRGKKYMIIPNAIESEKFLYNSRIRKLKREELNITDQFVIGHIGRFSTQKNHKYLINLFSEFLKIHSNSILLLIGKGENFNEIQQQVSNLRLEQKVIFLGGREDVSDLYQAMDVFILSSLYEGVPVVGIEAQFSNLPCIFSEGVPREVSFTNRTTFLELSYEFDNWIQAIMRYLPDLKRNLTNRSIHESKYNICNAYKILENYYVNISNI